MDFCHLHLHTEYSMLDGFGTASEYAQKAKRLGYQFLGCTDHGNIDGLITFQKACQKNKITPILGCEGYLIENSESKKRNGHICFWIKNNIGFKNLCSMLSIANLDDYYRRPLITYENLLAHHKGLIIGTACLGSFVNLPNGEKFFRELKKLKPNDIYAEVMINDIDSQKEYNKKLIALAEENNVPIILTHDCHYVKKRESKYQEMMLAIQRKAKWDDPKRWRFETNNLYLLSKKEIHRIAQDNNLKPEYLENTIKLAEKCKRFKIPKKSISLPPIEGINDEAKFMRETCEAKLKAEFGINLLYLERLRKEIDLILKKKFERYILIVWELCNWCRENKILIGPGRGSVGGSLVAYLLGITSIDPIKYNLLFERFIAEDRNDFPDIDLDFERSKIHLVKRHLEDLYGSENIAGVSTYTNYKAKNSVQDIARVFGIKADEVNFFTKMIDDDANLSEEELLANAIETDAGREFNQAYPEVLDYAKKITGRVKNYSQHPAAMVIATEKINTSGKCVLLRGKKDVRINWNKYDIEHVGFIKLDILRLRLLSIIGMALAQIKENSKIDLDLNKIDLEDKNVLAQIQNNRNQGVFQLNTYATKKLLEEIKIESFRSIIDLIALVRPGPNESGMTAQYIERQRTKQWDEKHKIYEEITQDTYGIVLFQEQVMAIISKIAGLPYSTADRIRSIISKKRDKKLFREYEKMFFEGCKKNKFLSKKEAEEFWEGLLSWSRYGFNRSHSTAYAILAYWCAYLKYYHPVEFISSALTYGAKEKKSDLIQEAYRLGLNVMPPKVGISDPIIWKSKGFDLFVPFSEIEGLGPQKSNEAATQPHLQKVKGQLKFVSMKNVVSRHKGKLGELLESIKAYSPNDNKLSTEALKLFDFEIRPKPEKIFRLVKKNLSHEELTQVLNADSKAVRSLCKNFIKDNKAQYYVDRDCTECDLYENSGYPINGSQGQKNLMIIGESPGKTEYALKKPFVGKSGKLLWSVLKPLDRELFHVTNVIKCFPVRKIEEEHISKCSAKHLTEEIKLIQPKLILAIGNKALKFFTGKDRGIIELNGQIFWNERYNTYIAWLIHPASVLRFKDEGEKDNSRLRDFKKAIKKFKRFYKTLSQCQG